MSNLPENIWVRLSCRGVYPDFFLGLLLPLGEKDTSLSFISYSSSDGAVLFFFKKFFGFFFLSFRISVWSSSEN